MNPATKEPEPKRGPYAGAKPFGYFSASGKVTRRKGETASRHTQTNGYAHNPKKAKAPKPEPDFYSNPSTNYKPPPTT